MKSLYVLFAIAILGIIAGCDGSSVQPMTEQVKVGQLEVALRWATSGGGVPAQAESVKLILTNGNGYETQQVIPRPSSGSETTTAFSNIPVGNIVLTTAAFPDESVSLTALACSTKVILIVNDSLVSTVIDMTSTIDHLTISAAPQTVYIGSTVQLVATAKDSDDDEVLVGPDDIAWSTRTPALASVDEDGVVTSLAEGTATIRATEQTSGRFADIDLPIIQANGGLIVAPVNPAISVSISADRTILARSDSCQFTAAVEGSPNQEVLWSVQESGGGTISPAGKYTAPDIAGNYHVVATCIIDPTKTASAEVRVIHGATKYQYAGQFGDQGGVNGQFYLSNALAIDPLGNLVVLDTGNHRMGYYTNDGAFLFRFGMSGSGDGEMNTPYGLAINHNGLIYVADTNNHRIQVFSKLDNFYAKWGSIGGGNTQFRYPRGVAIDLSGNILVADTGNSRIMKFTADGSFITKWGCQGTGTGEFNTPVALTTDPDGNVYIVDAGSHCVQKFTSTGDFVAKWGSMGDRDGYFRVPSGIAIDTHGDLYIADKGNHRIQKNQQYRWNLYRQVGCLWCR